jgi:hypothetical protein
VSSSHLGLGGLLDLSGGFSSHDVLCVDYGICPSSVHGLLYGERRTEAGAAHSVAAWRLTGSLQMCAFKNF